MHIGHVALRTPDLQGSVAFIQRGLGLRVAEVDDAVAYLSANAKHHELELIAGDRAGLEHLGLELESEAELTAVTERALAAGGAEVSTWPPSRGLGETMTIEGPGGIRYQLYAGMERAEPDEVAFLRPGIRRLGHLTFMAEDREEIRRFWLEGLGFRVSDEIEDVTWARCDDDHHGLAIGPRSSGNVLHHHAWEVQDVAALVQHCDSAAIEGMRQVWGPVRHGPGFNLATYMPDSHGALIEVYADLLRIDVEASYEPVNWDPVPEAMNLWGPPAPEEFFEFGVPVW